jgi:hypothetical protein
MHRFRKPWGSGDDYTSYAMSTFMNMRTGPMNTEDNRNEEGK